MPRDKQREYFRAGSHPDFNKANRAFQRIQYLGNNLDTKNFKNAANLGNGWRLLDATDQKVVYIGDGTNTFGDFDGTTQAVFNSAITELGSVGGKIVVLPGTYTISSQVDFTSVAGNISVEGVSRSTAGGSQINVAMTASPALKGPYSLKNLYINDANTADSNTQLLSTCKLIEQCVFNLNSTGQTEAKAAILVDTTDFLYQYNQFQQASVTDQSAVIRSYMRITGSSNVARGIIRGNLFINTADSSRVDGWGWIYTVAVPLTIHSNIFVGLHGVSNGTIYVDNASEIVGYMINGNIFVSAAASSGNARVIESDGTITNGKGVVKHNLIQQDSSTPDWTIDTSTRTFCSGNMKNGDAGINVMNSTPLSIISSTQDNQTLA